MDENINFVGELQRVQLRDGDTLVITTDQRLTTDMVNRLTDIVRNAFGEGVKALVLEGGTKVGVIGRDIWRPIDSAPRDGTSVLLWSDAWAMSWGELQIGHFQGDGEGGGEWVTGEGACSDNDPDFDPDAEFDPADLDSDDDGNFGPTHWAPMIAGPRA